MPYRTAFQNLFFGSNHAIEYEFDHTDFTNALGTATITFPFSLGVIVRHNRNHPLFVGVRYELNNQMVTIADRDQIAGVMASAGGSNYKEVLLGPGTVAPFSLLPQDVTRIVVTVTRDGTSGSIAEDCSVALQFDDPYSPQGNIDLIGSATSYVNDIAVALISSTVGQPIAPGSLVLLNDSAAYPYRMVILGGTLETWPTPSYNGDVRIDLTVNNVLVCTVSSSRYEYRSVAIPALELGYGAIIDITARNFNTTNSYNVNANVLYGRHL